MQFSKFDINKAKYVGEDSDYRLEARLMHIHIDVVTTSLYLFTAKHCEQCEQ